MTARDNVLELLRIGDNVAAMRIASRWFDLGQQKERISRGWAALCNGDFYRQIGKNPDVLFSDGVKALKERVCYD